MKIDIVNIVFNSFFSFSFYFIAINMFFEKETDMTDFFLSLLIANTFIISMKLGQIRDKEGDAK